MGSGRGNTITMDEFTRDYFPVLQNSNVEPFSDLFIKVETESMMRALFKSNGIYYLRVGNKMNRGVIHPMVVTYYKGVKGKVARTMSQTRESYEGFKDFLVRRFKEGSIYIKVEKQ